ncbi:MAG: aminoacyl-histidine dipeptidase [Deltaproteobacteria bacterium]|nr:aminoacyl-histidine dipeptidase [Deltaproteobacteria bacterium]
MTTAIQGLKPELMWKYFAGICDIPHQSKNEEAIRKWLVQLGESRGLEVRQDEVGNVLIAVPATKGYENAPTVVLQGHMDMVCEKNNDTVHNFDKDPIKLVREGDWITADGTTLGADNGIGVAAALAFLDDKDAIHGPLEILSTVDEETGLTGAFNLSNKLLTGKYMLNLDSEEDGALYVGCAGGADVKMHFNIVTAPVRATDKVVEISIKGLMGGHSGLNINENRGNALRILARMLKNLSDQNISWNLVKMDGGSAHNAIPREAMAQICVSGDNSQEAINNLENSFNQARVEYGKRETKMECMVKAIDVNLPVAYSRTLSDGVIDLMLLVPNGVLTMSQDLPDLVESSSNLATVKSDGKVLTVHISTRSSVGTVIPEIQQTAKIAGERCGADVEIGEGYPAWQPDMDSPLLAAGKVVFENLYGKQPLVKAIHAGLECGVIGEKFPGMQMLSFGPEIHGAHSPDEKVSIPTVERFWELLTALLKYIAEGKM